MPGSSSGTSIPGYQALLSGVSGVNTQCTVILNDYPVVDPKRVGYLYLYVYSLNPPYGRRIIERTPLYLPAIQFAIQTPLPNATFNYYAQAYWDVPGLAWTCGIS